MASHGTDENRRFSPSREFLRHIEEEAFLLRSKAGVGPLDKLDPFALAGKFNARIVSADKITDLPQEARQYIDSLGARTWSGISSRLPDGSLLIVLNHNQTRQRANVTILEEVAHAHYGHRPSTLSKALQRAYDEAAEREAYWTAAAVLLPSKAVARAIWQSQSAGELARLFGTSTELAEMRIKVLGLWARYRNGRSAAEEMS